MAAGDKHVATNLRAMRDILERSPGRAWSHARKAAHRISALNDVRIIQILDEFQYLNRWILADDNHEKEELCYSYMGTAESKVSPQIVAGSYIGWLGAILRHMTGRYMEWHLESLADEEALEAVYNYAYTYQVPLTEETAPYIAEVCENDPFYIAAMFYNRKWEKDLTTKEGVREALTFETVAGQGEIARVWREYLLGAFAEVNDTHARKIVLYLARHEPEERTRKQIRDDLDIDMEEGQLEKRMHQLVMSDILAEGSSNFHYRGLGDRIFAMVFRRIYGTEIEGVTPATIEDDFKKKLDSARRQTAWHKGRGVEYMVRYRLLVASLAGATLADIVTREPPPEFTLDRFVTIKKAHFHLDQDRHVEADLYAASEKADGTDLVVEVKAWERKPTPDVVRCFVEVKEALAGHFERKTAFLFYSESGLGEKMAATLAEAGILVLDPEKLASYELPETRSTSFG